ncbi:MAG: hypothetical protein WAV93_01925 [Bacteroidales bacterium]
MSVLAGLLALLPFTAFSQLSISYYSSNLSKIGLAYDFSPRFWTELRLYSDTDISSITPELVFCYNLANREFHKVYLGLGANVNYFTGFVMPIGVQFTPFEKFDRFSLHIELEPTLDLSAEDVIIQSSWGLRYKFLK